MCGEAAPLDGSGSGHRLIVGDDKRVWIETVEMRRGGVGIGPHAVDLDPIAILDIAGSSNVPGNTSSESQVGPLRTKDSSADVDSFFRRTIRAGT